MESKRMGIVMVVAFVFSMMVVFLFREPMMVMMGNKVVRQQEAEG